MKRFLILLAAFFEADDSQSKWRRVLGIGVLVGAIAILVWSGLRDRESTSAAFILAGAALFTGVLVGFLFGIPKTLQRKADSQLGTTLSEGDYLPNTNLEEISDWLTKMLVGVGLVQLSHLPKALESIGRYWGKSLGGEGAQPFAAGLVVYFGVIGFLLGYLWTRLGLVGDFIEKDPRRLITAVLKDVADAVRANPSAIDRSPNRQVMTKAELVAAQELQSISSNTSITLDHLRAELQALALEYQSVRATMPSSPERTRKLEIIASQMRAFSLAGYPLLSEFAQSQSPGERLVAVTFLQAKPDRNYYDWLEDRLRVETPFVAYHAGVALLSAARSASIEDIPILDRIVSRVLDEQRLPTTSDRYKVLMAAHTALKRQTAEEEGVDA